MGGFRLSIGHEEVIQTSRADEEVVAPLSPIVEEETKAEKTVVRFEEEKAPATPKKATMTVSSQKKKPPMKYEEMLDCYEKEDTTFKLDYATYQDTLKTAAEIIGG